MGITWVMFMSFKNKESISFINEGVQFQMPTLIVVILVKYIILACRRFKTSKKLFYSNLFGYTLFLVVVILLDYRLEIFGDGCPIIPDINKLGALDGLTDACKTSAMTAFNAAQAAAKKAAGL